MFNDETRVLNTRILVDEEILLVETQWNSNFNWFTAPVWFIVFRWRSFSLRPAIYSIFVNGFSFAEMLIFLSEQHNGIEILAVGKWIQF